MSPRRGAHFVPIGIPTICWIIFPRRNHENCVYQKLKHLDDVIFRALVFRVTSSVMMLWIGVNLIGHQGCPNLLWRDTIQGPFSHSGCRSSPVKTYYTSEHCRKKNSGTQWARTLKSFGLRIFFFPNWAAWAERVGFNFIYTVQRYIQLQCNTSLRHALLIILYKKKYVWALARCEHMILPISLKAIVFV